MDKKRSLPFFATRTAIGVALPDDVGSGYAVVAAERTFFPKEPDHLFSRYYVIIDEARTQTAEEQAEALIRLKDQYLVRTIYAEKCPYAERLRRTEGLTFYAIHDEYANRARWKTFEDVETVAGIRQLEVDNTAMRRDLDALLNANVTDPDTGQPILDGDLRPTPRLQVFGELNTAEAAAGLQPGMDDFAVMKAVWLAVGSLERSRPPLPESNKSPFEKEERGVGASGY